MYLPYYDASRQNIQGHYMVAQRSGEIAATLGALAHLARFRWAPGSQSTYAVLLRLRIGISVSAAVTDGRIEQVYRAIVGRQFTVDYTANMTAINLATTNAGLTNTLRSGTMRPSLLGASGPSICTTAGGTGQTVTADAAPFAVAPISPLLTATNSVGTATLLPAGTQAPMQTLYERTADGQHPVVLGNNEGVIVQNVLAGYASGTFALYTEWTWAEVFVF